MKRTIGILGLHSVVTLLLACGTGGATSDVGEEAGGAESGSSGGGPGTGGTGDGIASGGNPASSGGSNDGGAHLTGGSGGEATGGGGGASEQYLKRVDEFCDALCDALRVAPECVPPSMGCELSCLVERKEGKELGCSYEPVLDCVDAHPDVLSFSCETGVQVAAATTCDPLHDEYNACVAATGE